MSASPPEIDIVFCNDTILLFKGVGGRVPLIDTRISAGKFQIVTDEVKAIRNCDFFSR